MPLINRKDQTAAKKYNYVLHPVERIFLLFFLCHREHLEQDPPHLQNVMEPSQLPFLPLQILSNNSLSSNMSKRSLRLNTSPKVGCESWPIVHVEAVIYVLCHTLCVPSQGGTLHKGLSVPATRSVGRSDCLSASHQ